MAACRAAALLWLLSAAPLAPPALAGAAAAADSCVARCVFAGHCCTGNASSCQAPSCQLGCNFGAATPDVATCTATCAAAQGKCSFSFAGQSYALCGDCSNRWLNPANLTPEILPGAEPFFPPGFELPSCTSCGSAADECGLGCRLAFNASLHPSPPAPPPPPPVPEPPAPWPNPTPGFNFSALLTDSVVLQAAPSRAAVFGNVGTADASASVAVTVSLADGSGAYTVPATVSAADGRWKALLRATPDTGAAHNVTATLSCAGGRCGGAVTIVDVIFGDVVFVFGQSNAWLQMQYTYGRNVSFARIAAGAYDTVRVASGDSQANGLAPSGPPLHRWRHARDAAGLPAAHVDALDQFSAVGWHFAESVTDATGGAVHLGLISFAIGGSCIEEWITNDVAQSCYGSNPDANDGGNHRLWDNLIVPSLDMTVKMWLFYQGENNAGALHGNSARRAGYACMMPALVAAYRAAWSATPGTTDPLAPFGIVSLSTGDSEGAGDIASFRFAQSASYFGVPNPALPGVFLAHAYDLADPWGDACTPAPMTKKCPGCDTLDAEFNCLTPYYMGPSIHPRLKQPVGARLAASALALAYGRGGAVMGPTLVGCALDAAAGTLRLAFDAAALAGGALQVRAYDAARRDRSGLSVLVNATGAAGSGVWVALNVALAGPAAVDVDLAPLGGATPQAVKYAWGPTGGPPNTDDVACCDAASDKDLCTPGGCPLYVAQPLAPYGGLPANPFLAQVMGGKCVCPEPTACA